MALLLCGEGLRLLQCFRLRVKEVDSAANHIVIRDAGQKGSSHHSSERQLNADPLGGLQWGRP